MASNTGWDKTVPSGTSLVNVGDDDIRSFKSFMEAWWEEQHYGTDGSATSAGEHKLGSGRAYVGTSSQLSNPVTGRLFLNSTDSAVWGALSSNTWTRVASDVQLDSVNTWSAQQNYSSGVSASDVTVVSDLSVGGTATITNQSRTSTEELVVGSGAAIKSIATAIAVFPAGMSPIGGGSSDFTLLSVSGLGSGDVAFAHFDASARNANNLVPGVQDVFGAGNSNIKVTVSNLSAGDHAFASALTVLVTTLQF